MTFSTAWDYQRNRPAGIPPSGCSPNLLHVEDYLMGVYGGQPVGCREARPIRGGTTPSTHTYGAAIDWRYANVGAGRRNVSDIRLVFDDLTRNAQAYGVQAIHDYAGILNGGVGRIWKIERGWKDQAKSSTGMGQRWAQWLHIETHPTAWHNDVPIIHRAGVMLPSSVPTEQPTRPEVPVGQPAAVTVTLDTLALGATGSDVLRFQGIYRALADRNFVVDGKFGPVTETAVTLVQKWHHLTVDGVVGPQTWSAILEG